MRAIGYIRVSTEEQAKNGLSLSAQKEKIQLQAKL
ncbi:MAG: recombinase family protein, partial [Ignavibacteriae bacterium]|nr:recombinase family protein [Ignavibacteriota bacterium]